MNNQNFKIDKVNNHDFYFVRFIFKQIKKTIIHRNFYLVVPTRMATLNLLPILLYSKLYQTEIFV